MRSKVFRPTPVGRGHRRARFVCVFITYGPASCSLFAHVHFRVSGRPRSTQIYASFECSCHREHCGPGCVPPTHDPLYLRPSCHTYTTRCIVYVRSSPRWPRTRAASRKRAASPVLPHLPSFFSFQRTVLNASLHRFPALAAHPRFSRFAASPRSATSILPLLVVRYPAFRHPSNFAFYVRRLGGSRRSSMAMVFVRDRPPPRRECLLSMSTPSRTYTSMLTSDPKSSLRIYVQWLMGGPGTR